MKGHFTVFSFSFLRSPLAHAIAVATNCWSLCVLWVINGWWFELVTQCKVNIFTRNPPSNCLDVGSCQRLFCSSVFAFIWNFLWVSSDFAIKAEEAASGRSDSTVSTVQLIPQKWIILATSWYFGIRRDKRDKQKQVMYFSGALTQFTVIACAAEASCSEFNNRVWVLKAIYSDA